MLVICPDMAKTGKIDARTCAPTILCYYSGCRYWTFYSTPAKLCVFPHPVKRIPGLMDHSPPGLDLPEVELSKRFFRSMGRSANLHVREKGRFNQRYPLLCRDYLRAHPVAAGAYAQIKQRLARRFPTDEEAYYEIKDPVFDIIMEGANDWAENTNWSEPPGD